MQFDLNNSIQVLSRTPKVLEVLLSGLDLSWTHSNEGKDTWSPFDVVGHLIEGEKHDWIQRMNKILSDDDKNFKPFDRFAQFESSQGKDLRQLLTEFTELRTKNLEALQRVSFTKEVLARTGVHPVFGMVTMENLLSTWVVHDLSHLAQIARVMCKQYKKEVGPWIEFMPILSR